MAQKFSRPLSWEVQSIKTNLIIIIDYSFGGVSGDLHLSIIVQALQRIIDGIFYVFTFYSSFNMWLAVIKDE